MIQRLEDNYLYMSFVAPHTNALKVAKIAFRTAKRRVARGYVPSLKYVYAVHESRSHFLFLKLINDKPKRKNDLPSYEFFFPCSTSLVAKEAVDILENMYLEQPDSQNRTGETTINKVIEQNYV